MAFMTGVGLHYAEIFVEYFTLFRIVMDNFNSSNNSSAASNNRPMILLGLILFTIYIFLIPLCP